MKKLLLLMMSMAVALGALACIKDTDRLVGAGANLAAAVAISDAELKSDARQMRTMGDAQNKVAPNNNKYAQRPARITKGLNNEDGLDLNFKVYITSDINANATPDGSIRVYSGLMDLMNDDELFFIIGHEIGHVKNEDSLNAMRVAYATAGVRTGAGAANNTLADLSDSVLGDLMEAVVNAQFSQSQESDSDLYGYQLLLKYKRNPQAGVTALQKLDSLGASGGFLSSHPNSAERANAIAKLIAEGSNK